VENTTKRYIVETNKVAHNIAVIREKAGNAMVYAVVKCDGYGTGCHNLARVCAENGLRRLYHAPANYAGELYDYALENGYKPLVEPEKPEDGYWLPQWHETEDEIVLEWVETEAPEEESIC
jgi:hypothetical protein